MLNFTGIGLNGHVAIEKDRSITKPPKLSWYWL
jgi:hypothetical protein